MKSLFKQVVVSTALVSVGLAGSALADSPKVSQLQPLLTLQQGASLPVLASNGRALAFQGNLKAGEQALFVSRLDKNKFTKPVAMVNSNAVISQSKQRLTGLSVDQNTTNSLAVNGNRLAFLAVGANEAQGLFYAQPRGKQPAIIALAMLGQPAPQSKQTFAVIADPVILVNRQNTAVAFEARLNQTDAAGVYLAKLSKQRSKDVVTLVPVVVPGQKLANKTIAQAVIRGSIRQGRELMIAVNFTNGSSALYQFKA